MRRVFGAMKDKEPSPSINDASDRINQREAVKARAMRILKQKRMYEGQRDMLYNQTFNLDQVAFASEGIKDAQQTMTALKVANKELKGMMKTVKIRDIDNGKCIEKNGVVYRFETRERGRDLVDRRAEHWLRAVVRWRLESMLKRFSLPEKESHKGAKTRSELVRNRKAILGLGFEKERWEILVAAAEREEVEAAMVALWKRARSSKSSAIEIVIGCLRGRI
ncbi:hypothetical protein Q3G72_011151 [Acer saccharum]|nr:hypothetical protein Q3G72_011151 [Acer saccharum]